MVTMPLRKLFNGVPRSLILAILCHYKDMDNWKIYAVYGVKQDIFQTVEKMLGKLLDNIYNFKTYDL